jgi:hypothetical protein
MFFSKLTNYPPSVQGLTILHSLPSSLDLEEAVSWRRIIRHKWIVIACDRCFTLMLRAYASTNTGPKFCGHRPAVDEFGNPARFSNYDPYYRALDSLSGCLQQIAAVLYAKLLVSVARSFCN